MTFPTVDFLDEEMMAEEDVVRVPATLTRLGRDAFVFEHVPPEIDDEQPEDEEGSGDGEGEGDGEALEEEDWDGKARCWRLPGEAPSTCVSRTRGTICRLPSPLLPLPAAAKDVP